MLYYLLGFLVLYSVYTNIRFFVKRRNLRNVPLMKGADPVYHIDGPVGIFIVHGLTSTPSEFKDFIVYLKARHYSVSVPLLPGHGTSPDDLYCTDWEDWLEAARSELVRFRKDVEYVYVVGSSMGGIVALSLVADDDTIDGVVSVAPPFKFRHAGVLRVVLPVMRLFKKHQKKIYFNPRDQLHHEKSNVVRYTVMPLRSGQQFFEMLTVVREKLKNVTVPMLVLQSDSDYQVGLDNAQFVYDSVSSKVRKVCIVHDAYHSVLREMDKAKREKAFEYVLDFIKDNEKRKSQSSSSVA